MKEILDEMMKNKNPSRQITVGSYEKEKIFSDLKYVSYLRYDFFIVAHPLRNPIICEIDGEQHFGPSYFFSEKEWLDLLKRDVCKSQYAITKKFHMLRISYKYPISKYSKLLDSFFTECLAHENCNQKSSFIKMSCPAIYKKLEEDRITLMT